MTDQPLLLNQLHDYFGDMIIDLPSLDMVTVEVSRHHLIEICETLQNEPCFNFDMLIDVCGVDYLQYGCSEWRTQSTTATGFSRAVAEQVVAWDKPRFAVVYQLLSLKNNQRLRLKVFLDEAELAVPSVTPIWNAANWFEREAFDLFGIQFDGHPDLRRLLTDYGFKGHPFRKDFPLIGELELRYDATAGRCVYEPVSIQPRVVTPKVIRDDNRYAALPSEEGNPNA